MALGGAPHFGLAVLGIAGDAGLGLDIALVHGLGLEVVLDDDVGLLEALLNIAHGVFDALGHVGGLVGLGIDALGKDIIAQQRRVRLHRLHDVHDMGQDLVFDLDQLDRLAGNGGGRGGDGGDRMAVIEHLAPRHHVAGLVVIGGPRLHIGEVGGGHHGLDAGKGLGGGGVDGEDAGVGMGAALEHAMEHAGQVNIGAEARPTGDLVDPVGLDRPGADGLEYLVLLEIVGVQLSRHVTPPSCPRPRRARTG